jgi:hypothetical protein
MGRHGEKDRTRREKDTESLGTIKNAHFEDPMCAKYRILIFTFAAGFGTTLYAGCRVSSGRSLHRS